MTAPTGDDRYDVTPTGRAALDAARAGDLARIDQQAAHAHEVLDTLVAFAGGFLADGDDPGALALGLADNLDEVERDGLADLLAFALVRMAQCTCRGAV